MTFIKIFYVNFTKFRGKSVENSIKNPHKTNFFLKMWKMWKSQLSKSVGIQEEYVFSTFPQFSKTFWTYISQKIF